MPRTKTDLKEKQTEAVLKESKKIRTFAQLIEATPTSIKDFSNAELLLLADEGAKKDKEMKALTAEVEVIKNIMRMAADELGWKKVVGTIGKCIMSYGSETSIDVLTLAKYLKKVGKSNLFSSFVKVRVGDVKKFLGEDVADEIGVTTVKDKATVSLKMK